MERLKGFLRRGNHSIAEALQIPSDVSQGRSKLVGDIDHQIFTQLVVPLKAIGHTVKRGCQLANLVFRGDLDPCRVIA